MILYIIFSIAKTGTTSLFSLLSSQFVVRTHNFENFEFHNMKKLHPKYPMDFTGNMDKLNEIATRFREIRVIGSFRHPLKRRISQYLHSLNIDMFIAGPDLTCPILRDALVFYLKNNRKYTLEETKAIFKAKYCNELPTEYINYINKLKILLKVDAILNTPLATIYANKPTKVFLYKLECIKDIQPQLLEFLGLPQNTVIPRELDRKKVNHFVDGNIEEIAQELEKVALTYPTIRKMLQHELIKKLFPEHQDLIATNP
jgi:hypothetical protein